MDSGVLDSLLDFGINSKREDRVGERVVLKCAPLKTEGYTSGWINASDRLSDSDRSILRLQADSQIILFSYGAYFGQLSSANDNDFTYLYTPDAVASWNRSTWGGTIEDPGFLLV